MAGESIETRHGALRVAVVVLSVGILGGLALAIAQDHFTEWRAVQERYNALARAAGKPEIAMRLRQIWKPDLQLVDRCSSCHLGAAGVEPLPGDPLFAEHPRIPHEPREFGCTTCHGGEGRATTAAAAHGERGDGVEAILARPYFDAGCGACHTGLRTPSEPLAAIGEQRYREYDCKACHEGARSLDGVGLRPIASDWHDRHVGKITDGIAFAPLDDADVPAVSEYLRTFVGAPGLLAGKRLAAQRGCRGCHRVNGVGGDDGPDLTDVALRPPERLPPAKSKGLGLAAWHKVHLAEPRWAVTDSLMPKLGFDDAQAGSLTAYVLSLRPRALPEALVPRDRLLTGRLGERDFATDGASIYGAFCAACHGLKGEGRESEDGLGNVPSLANADFLALADDPFLRRTIAEGRAGRRMAGWANRDGGLRAAEIESVLAFVRAFEPPAPSFAQVQAAPVDQALGRETFGKSCAPCHGEAGAGSVLAPPLAAKDNEVTIDDNRIYGTLATGIAGTAMGSFRRFDAATLRGVIAATRALPRLDVPRKDWKVAPGAPARGEPLFVEHCAKCHGKAGEGDKGPAIQNPAFLAVAGDGYLAGTIIRGRPGTKMPTFGVAGAEHARLAPADVADVVAFLRSKARSVKREDPPKGESSTR